MSASPSSSLSPGGSLQPERTSSKVSVALSFIRETSKLIDEDAKQARVEQQGAPNIPPMLMWMDTPLIKNILIPAFSLCGGVSSVMYSALGHSTAVLIDNQAVWGSFLGYVGAVAIALPVAFTKCSPPSIAQSGRNYKIAIDNDKMVLLSLTGGILGALYAIGTVMIVGNIGNGPFFVFSILGQLFGALLFDMTGVLWTRQNALNWLVYAGTGLAVIGAFVFQMNGFLNMSSLDITTGKMVGNIVGTVVCGTLPVIQGAINSKFNRVSGSARRTPAWSFLTGVILLGLVVCGVRANWDNVNIDWSKDWWKFSAGFFAVYGNIAAFVFTLFIGFAMYFIYMMVGSLITSLLFDNFGVFGAPVQKADAWRISGLIIVLISVVTVQLGKLHANKVQQRTAGFDGEPFEDYSCDEESPRSEKSRTDVPSTRPDYVLDCKAEETESSSSRSDHSSPRIGYP